MVRESIIKLLKETASIPTDPGGLATLWFSQVYKGNNPRLDLTGAALPFCIVGTEEEPDALAVLGDDKRERKIKITIELFADNMADLESLVEKVRRVIRTSETVDENGDTVQGIGMFLYYFRLRMDAVADPSFHTWVSGQPNWFTTPTPIIYKNGVVAAEARTIDYANGQVVFGSPVGQDKTWSVTAKIGHFDVIETAAHPITPMDGAEGLYRFSYRLEYETFLLFTTSANPYF